LGLLIANLFHPLDRFDFPLCELSDVQAEVEAGGGAYQCE
jgi:hypothetical protein